MAHDHDDFRAARIVAAFVLAAAAFLALCASAIVALSPR